MDDPDTQTVLGLKDPWKFLSVDMDIAMAAACFGFGLLTMGLPTPVVVAGGGALGYVMHKARKGKPKGFAMHLTYWYLPPMVSRLKRVPPNWASRTVG